MTRVELASAAGLPIGVVRALERGRPVPAHALSRIASVLGASVADLVNHPRMDPVTLGVSATTRAVVSVAVDARLRVVDVRSYSLRREPDEARRGNRMREILGIAERDLHPERVVVEVRNDGPVVDRVRAVRLILDEAMDEFGITGTLADLAEYLARFPDLGFRIGSDARVRLKTADGRRALRPLLGAAAVAYALARREFVAQNADH